MTRLLRAICATVPVICCALTLDPRSADAAACEDFVPAGCTRVKAGDRLDAVIKNKCYVFDENSTGDNAYDSLNILEGGKVLFVDPGKVTTTQKARVINFKVSAMLVERGGVFQAGSTTCPFGKEGGKLAIGIYGDDPTKQGTVNPPPVSQKGIQCQTNSGTSDPTLRCFPSDAYKTGHYCTEPDSDDPCSNTSRPQDEPNNKLLEPYGTLPFDDNAWGYKTIGVAYGGTLALYGYNGARGLQDSSWATANDPKDHCAVPSVSGLDDAEMRAWAGLTGNSWARLAGSTTSGEKSTITLDRKISDWQVDDWIVVGATDWYPNHSELRQITKITPLDIGTQIEIEALKYPHSASMFSAGAQSDFSNPVSRSAVDMRAVVGLLSRSIQVYSLSKTKGDDFPKTVDCTVTQNGNNAKPECYFGGHLIFRQGFKQVAIQGVEFKWLGQGGRMGHYPVHFHMAKTTSYTNGNQVSGTFVKDSAVWDSMTRFVVLHGTHDVTVSRNVGYLSLGHGYFIEDASEIRNRLCHNLGVGARAALQQYVAEQQNMEHWCGGEPPPSARVVPPILDGVISNRGETKPRSATGSDTYMPTMFWMMNAYNEFVGNTAVGVHGFGSCFWLLGSAVSGASLGSSFDGFANYNTTTAQAPLLRFRGNSCMTSPLGLPSTREVPPGGEGPSGNELEQAKNTGYVALANPYLTNGANASGFSRPIVNGSYRPALNAKAMSCSPGSELASILDNNTQTCVMTVLDRFSTSYNWAEVNFASVWLRPFFYYFANGAVTDQLFGGLGIVTGGDWQQAPPAYLALAQNNLFVGTTNTAPDATNLYARRSGPRFPVKDTDLGAYSLCPSGKTTCNFHEAGTGFWRGAFQPKRMITIYDGPTYADGNTFLNVGAWECNAQPCSDASNAAGCTYKVNGQSELQCGIYSGTTQPFRGNTNIAVMDAAIGWKQPNGFYYPPAFDYRRSSFLKNRSDAFNMCLTSAPGDYKSLKFTSGGCRHNVLDRTQTYLVANMEALKAKLDVASQRSGPLNQLDAGTIDFATILLDLDGSLTGATSTIDGRTNPGLTTSVSRNIFYDAPSQSPECLAYGVQTSPYTYISTVMGALRGPPSTTKNAILRGGGGFGGQAAIPIYRQWKLTEDEEREKTDPCQSVCDNNGQYQCKRASFMGMANLAQPSYLTMTQPTGLGSAQTGGLYYIDTNSAKQSLSCVKGNGGFTQANFLAETSYILYNLFPQRDSKTTYQIYVGDVKELTDIEFRWVRVSVHETDGSLQRVEQPCDPRQPNQWCSAMLPPKPVKGVLTVTVDHKKLLQESAFTAEARPEYDRCMPRDICAFDTTTKKCVRCDPSPSAPKNKCLRAGDFLPADIASMNATDKHGRKPLDAVCEEWSQMISGQVTVNKGASVTSADCPAGGCLGFAFKLPKGFDPQPYQQVNGGQGGLPLSRCFVESAWMKDVLNKTPNDTQCGAPRPQSSSDFCSDPKLDLPPEGDASIDGAEPTKNTGENPDLAVVGDGDGADSASDDLAEVAADVQPVRSLVKFDAGAIESWLANRQLTRATLELTTSVPVDGQDLLLDANPLSKDFAEGDPEDEPPGESAALDAAETASAGGLARTTGLIPIGSGRGRLPVLPGGPTPTPGEEDVPGVTWDCASDLDTGNGVSDCAVPWTTPGGDFAAATSAPALATGGAGTVVSWDVTQDVMNGVSSWLIRLQNEGQSGRIFFYSEEGAMQIGDSAVGPVLILE